MLQTFWTFWSCNNHLYILWKNLRQPKCDICLSSCLAIHKQVNSFNNYDDFMVNFLCTENDQLFLYLSTANIKPVREKLSYILLKKINILFKFECLSKFYYNTVKWIKVVSIVTAITCEMHDWENFIFFVLVLVMSFLPVDENGFDSTTWLGFEYKRFIGLSVIFDIRGDFMDVFFLTWEELFLFVILKSGFTGAEIKGNITQCSLYIFHRDFFCHWGQSKTFYLKHDVRNCYLCLSFPCEF